MQENQSKFKYKRSAITKEKVLSEAFRLMDEKGYENVTVKMICQESGISVGAFYYYFSSKEELLSEGQIESEALFMRKCNAADIYSIKDPIAFVRKLFTCYAEVNENLGPVLYPRYGTHVPERNRSYYNMLFQFLLSCQQEGIINNTISAEEQTRHFYFCARGVTLDWCLHNGKYNLNKELQSALTPLINYYLTSDEQ